MVVYRPNFLLSLGSLKEKKIFWDNQVQASEKYITTYNLPSHQGNILQGGDSASGCAAIVAMICNDHVDGNGISDESIGNILDKRAPEHLSGIRESIKKTPSNRKLEQTVNIGFDEAFIYLREKNVVKDYHNPGSLELMPGNLLDRDYVMENIIKPLHESDGCSAIGKFQIGVMN